MKNLTSKIQWRSGVIALSTLALLSLASSSVLAGHTGGQLTAAAVVPADEECDSDCHGTCATGAQMVCVDAACVCDTGATAN